MGEANLRVHVNIPDDRGEVYCYLTGEKLSFKNSNMARVRHQCFNCKFFGGTAQGQGVECVYADPQSERE